MIIIKISLKKAYEIKLKPSPHLKIPYQQVKTKKKDFNNVILEISD